MNVYYQPTALEQVHGLYLAQNVFGVQPNYSHSIQVNISGRNAVPFLTQSGVDRMLLRNIWSAADPDNVGSLTSIDQLYVMLRLVSMAQAGMLNIQQDSTLMITTLQQQSSIQLMLPTFSSVVIPQQEQLFNMYGTFVKSTSNTPHPQPPPAMGFGMEPQNSFGGGGGGIQNVHSFGSTQASTGGTVTTSISDAFGDLGPVENAPLPSFGEIPQPTQAQQQQPTLAQDGGTSSDPSLVGTNSFPSTDGSAMTGGGTTTSSISDVFGSGISDAPLPPLGGGGGQGMGEQQQQQSQVNNDEDDECGDFGTATAAATTPSDLLGTSQQPTGGTGDSSLVGTNSFPSTDGSAMTGGTASISDVFGSGVHDAPLPSLGGTQQGMAEQPQKQNAVNNDDDFGDFGSAAPSSSAPPGPDMTSSFHDFTSSSSSAAGPGGMPITDAFGNNDMADINQQQTAIVQSDDDNDFGGFENAAAAAPATTTNSEPDEFNTFQNASPPVVDDPFGAMQVPDAPMMSLDQFGSADIAGGQNQGTENAVVVDASTATNQPLSNDFNETTAPAEVPTNNDDDPFGSWAQPDAPVMSLDQFGSTDIGSNQVTNVVSDTENENKEDDEFGGFEDAVSAPSGMPVGAQDASEFQDQAGSEFNGFQDASSSMNNNDKGFTRQMSSGSQYSTASSQISESQQPNHTATPSNNLQSKLFVETVTSPQPATPSTTAADPFSTGAQSDKLQSKAFVETVTSPQLSTPSTVPDAFSAFDAVTPSPAVPLPPLVETVTSGTGDTPISIDGGNAGFSNFESTPAPVLESAAPASAPPTGEKGDLFDVPEQQGSAESDMRKATTAAPTDATDEDNWGGFDSAVPAATTSVTGGPDLFGAPESQGLAESDMQKATIAASTDTADGEDDWGGFDAAPTTTAATSTTAGDDMDLFGSPKTEQAQNVATISSMPEATDDWGDFGAAPTTAPQTGDGTDFFGGAPETSEAQNAPTATPTPDATDDDWGDFGNAPASTTHADGNDDLFGVPRAPTATQNATIAAVPPQGTDDDDWGDFGTAPSSAPQLGADTDLFAAPATTETQEQTTPPKPTDEDWGDFGTGGAASAQPDTDLFGASETATETQNATIAAPPDTNDDWGAFDTAAPSVTAGTGDSVDPFNAQGSTTDQHTTIAAPPEGNDDDWGAFDNAPSAPAQEPLDNAARAFDDTTAPASGEPVNTGNDDWGAFDNAPSAPAPEVPDKAADFGTFDEAPAPSSEPVNSGDDDWGAFDNAPSVPAPTATEAQDDADFGAFDEAPISSASVSTDDDDWGDFGNAPSAPVPAAGAEDSDFGNFETAAFDQKPTAVDNQEKIRALSTKLPEALLRKNDSSEHVDLVECYEVHLGMDFPLDPLRGKRFDRCIQLLELLSEEDSKLGSAYWQQALVVIRDELQLGKSILLEGKGLSQKDFGKIKKPLSVMMAGMIEYMRITRSIVATFGDILMLDASALLTIDTWKSTWCSLSILETAIEIETLWKDLLAVANGLLKLDKARINDIDLAMIRKNLIGRTPSGKLCHLTLQPLGKKSDNTTRSKVTWNGLHYMACSANFLAHKCPFYVISSR